MEDGRMLRFARFLAITASVAGLFAGSAAAQQTADQLLDSAAMDGPFRVTRMTIGASTLYVPEQRDPSDRFDVLVWGNGTGGNANTYQVLLTSIATQGILVAAANTANSGSGREMQAALRTAMDMFGNLLNTDLRICTAGHSQGGGGSFNAQPLTMADCVIAVQPDTRFTIQIAQPVAAGTEVIVITADQDNLAPKAGNEANVQRNSPDALVEVQTTGQDHFAPVGGRGGRLGDVFRAASIAQLRPAAEAAPFRGLFFGPDSPSTVTADTQGITVVERNADAIALTGAPAAPAAAAPAQP
jgi:hypothetical protein